MSSNTEKKTKINTFFEFLSGGFVKGDLRIDFFVFFEAIVKIT